MQFLSFAPTGDPEISNVSDGVETIAEVRVTGHEVSITEVGHLSQANERRIRNIAEFSRAKLC